MKSILTIFVLLTLASCGKTHQTKYIENPYDNSENEARLAELDQRVNSLEASMSATIRYMDSLASTEELEQLQSKVDMQLVELADLQLAGQPIAFLDPCGNSAGYDEILLGFNDGKVVAYFEDGGKRFLTVLEPGVSYQTTDSSRCNFKIDTAGNLVYN